MEKQDSKIWQEKAKDNPFRVPDGYFESFQSRMMNTISESDQKTKGKTISMRMTKWISGVAAVLLLGLIGFQQFYLKPHHDEIASEAMYSVIEYFAMDLDDMSMTELMADNNAIDLDANDNNDSDLLEWMDIDEITLIEAVLNEAN